MSFIAMVCNWWGLPWLSAVVWFAGCLYFPFWLCQLKRYMATNMCYGGQNFAFGATGKQFFSSYFMAFLIIVGFSFIIGIAALPFFEVAGVAGKSMSYVILVFSLFSYIGYLLAYALIQADLTNKVWNKLQIGPLRFNCNLKTLELGKIYVTNAIGILFSLGLLIPWAVVRTFRYRVEHTQVINNGELASFRGTTGSGIKAVGAEVTDFFNLDLSL